MSQSGARPAFDFITDQVPRSAPSNVWPPAEWVETPVEGMRVLMHRSGVRLVKLRDGTINVHRGDCEESWHTAGIIEDFLWGTGFMLRAGGGPDDRIAVYGPP